jgi:aminopeptidase N
LKITSLYLLRHQHRAWAEEQYYGAKNMTDSLAALQILADDPETAPQALGHFYERWQEDALVLNKWFTVQAVSWNPNTFDNVKQLAQHPKFNILNPNNVYSLLRSFGANNYFFFHDPSGLPYEFLADRIIEVDSRNAHVGSALAGCFRLWKKLIEPQQGQARKALQRVLDSGKLSRNTYEIVAKSLV